MLTCADRCGPSYERVESTWAKVVEFPLTIRVVKQHCRLGVFRCMKAGGHPGAIVAASGMLGERHLLRHEDEYLKEITVQLQRY